VNKPLTKEEIRFTESWREQREGSKMKYYLLYTVSWGLLIVFISFFLLMFAGGISIIPIAQDNSRILFIIILGFILGFFATHIVRTANEKKYQKILEKVRNTGTSI